MRFCRANAGAVMLGLLWIAGAGCQDGAENQPPPDAALRELIRDRPEATLIRQWDGAWLPLEAAAGVALSHRVCWVEALGAVRLETEWVHTNASAAASAEVGFGELKFRLHTPKDGPPYERLAPTARQWYGSGFWSGPRWTRVGKDWQHPGEDTPSVRTFRAPRAGRITVSGRAYKLHLEGDGVRLAIRHQNRQLWEAEIDGADDQGVAPRLSLEVQTGDLLRFIVHKRGTILCDTTHWDPIVAYPTGAPYQASAGFSVTQQGEGGWFYDLLAEDVPEQLHPRLLAMGSEGLLTDRLVTPTQPVRLTFREALPCFVIADGANQSGVVLAVNASTNWSFQARLETNGWLRLRLGSDPGHRREQRPGASGTRLPDVWLAAYDGPFLAGFPIVQRLLEAGQDDAESRIENPVAAEVTRLDSQRKQILLTSAATVMASSPELREFASAMQRGFVSGTFTGQRVPEADLLLMAQAEWLREDQITGAADSFGQATTNHLERAARLLADVRRRSGDEHFPAHAAQLAHLQGLVDRPNLTLTDWRELYRRVRVLKRDLVFRNPLVDFGELLFCRRRAPTYSHLVGQYFGWRQQPGGDLRVLKAPGYSRQSRELVGGQLPPGSYLEPRVSPDGRKVVFSFVACPEEPLDCATLPVNEAGADVAYFHLYEINTDGTGLRQLTTGKYDDLMPEYLPDGDLVFCSTRRRSYSRCFHVKFSERWHSYTLFRREAMSGALQPLSFNDVNEWFPAVANDGRLLFARWDYVDRDAVTHQNLWSMRPDGTHPQAVWGNATPSPHCMFQARSIPGSRKIVFVASAHHAQTGGPVCVLDPSVDNNSRPEAITRITPGPFPEAESWQVPDYYESPWPLSEQYFLVAYSPEPLRFENTDLNPDNALGLYLLDAAGNRELIFRDPQISSTTPIPLRARTAPPILASARLSEVPTSGEMILQDVYRGLGTVPRGSIKRLRVIQVFPKTTRDADRPRVGFAGEENARAILGTVPMEADGSARFRVPAGKPLLFQVLDADGFAWQTMRSSTSVQPGETVACVGCHDNQMATVPVQPLLALQRPASVIAADAFEGEPFSFLRVVQPVLDRHCVRCHGGEKTEKDFDLTRTIRDGFTHSYWSLCGQPTDFDFVATNPRTAASAWVPRFGRRNQIQATPPGGQYGARGSRLLNYLRDGHEGVQLSAAELRRLAAWMDCNSVFYGTYDPREQGRQLAGERIDMPLIQ